MGKAVSVLIEALEDTANGNPVTKSRDDGHFRHCVTVVYLLARAQELSRPVNLIPVFNIRCKLDQLLREK